MVVAEEDSFSSQSVDMGRLQKHVARKPEDARVVIVDCDQDDVWPATAATIFGGGTRQHQSEREAR